MRTLYNILQSQIGWFALVLSAAAGRPAVGACIAAALIVIHVVFAPERRAELVLIGAAAATGAIVDSALLWLGMIQFPTSPQAALAPVWMITLWMLFATTLRHSLAWLQRRPALAGATGAAAGPLAYFAGERLGALQTSEPLSYAAIGALWALALPWLLHVASAAARQRSQQYA